MNNITVIGVVLWAMELRIALLKTNSMLTLVDISEDQLKNALFVINKNLDRQVARSILTCT